MIIKETVPGMSGQAIGAIYGDKWPLQGPIGICKPKEYLVFNDEIEFYNFDTYPYEFKGDKVSVLCLRGREMLGLVNITREMFNELFDGGES
jgi:hypothetical protein